jgi:hypothetical protein
MPLERTNHRAERSESVLIVNGRQIEMPRNFNAVGFALALRQRRSAKVSSIEEDLRSNIRSVRLDAMRRKRDMLLADVRALERRGAAR